MRSLWLALAVLLLSACPAAAALTARAEEEIRPGNARTPDYPVYVVAVASTAAEVNDVVIEASGTRDDARRTIRIRDAAAPVTPGPGCVAVDDHELRCETMARLDRLTVDAGEGDDRVRLAAPLEAEVMGGPGDDDLGGNGSLDGGEGDDRLRAGPAGSSLTGGAGDDQLDGGDGSDRLFGGAGPGVAGGADVLRGGPGFDRLSDADGDAPGPDVLDGGAGTDTVVYAGRRTPVVLTLAGGGRGGSAGEGDALSGFESAVGGEAADDLTGSAGADVLEGGGGEDRLRGLAGDDRLDGGDGGDRLEAGPGRDSVSAGAGQDLVIGGPGRDSLSGAFGRDDLRGGDGDDEVGGGEGSDRVDGGAGRDTLGGGGAEDHLLGGSGADSLDGGARRDRVDAGGGDDRVVATADFFGDAIACGTGRDHARLDPGDRPAGCERVARAAPRADRPYLARGFVPRPLRGPVYRVDGDRVRPFLLCLDLGVDCTSRIVATARAGGRRVVVLRGALRCDDPPTLFDSCDSAQGDLRVTRAGRRLLAARGRLRARVVIRLAPGRRAGAIALGDRLTLRRG